MNRSEENASLSLDEETSSKYAGIDQQMLRHLVLAPDMENCDDSGDDDDDDDSPVSTKKAEKAKWTLDEVQSKAVQTKHTNNVNRIIY
jgi:hypothetical protein